MAVAKEDWSRPAFEPGGGDASLFYLVFGRLGPVRLPPAPSGLSLTVHPQGEARLWVEPLVASTGGGQNGQGALAGLVRSAPDFAVLRGQRADPPDLGYLRDAESVLAALLEAGAAAVLDVEAQRWWTPAGFRGEVLNGVRPAVRAHVSVRARTGVVETRGLRKFGRPDLRLYRVPADAEPEAVGLCWSLVERLARGVRPGPGFSAGRLRLRPSGEPGHPALEGEWPEPPLPRASNP
ncbi:MAG TPA: hypothetical protein VMT11_04880 [Myxococcaceae bacterium]|nr:hypothetical protein [Myxococcaceae bacterium]